MQIPFPKKQKLPPLPSIGYTLPESGYQGPRITKAPVTVASHVKAYYWFCASVVALLMMAVLGAIAVSVASGMNTSCPASSGLMTWFSIFGITDLSVFALILIIVIVRAICCPHRSGLLGWIAVLTFTVHCLAFFLYGFFALIAGDISIFGGGVDTISSTVGYTFVTYVTNPYTVSSWTQSNYCNTNVRNFAILLFMLLALGLTAPVVYLIMICKGKCCRKTNSSMTVTPQAP